MSKQQSRVSSKKKNNTRSGAIQKQYAALPYRVTKTRGIEFLLVTSRDSGRWIIPKGWPIAGLKPARTAAQEAYEEAGVRGVVGTKAIGEYSYTQGHGLRASRKKTTPNMAGSPPAPNEMGSPKKGIIPYSRKSIAFAGSWI